MNNRGLIDWPQNVWSSVSHQLHWLVIDFTHYSSISSRGSAQFVQKIPATPPSECILLLDGKILSEIEGHRQSLEMQQKKFKKAQEKGNNEKIEHMKQGPTENMTIAVLNSS